MSPWREGGGGGASSTGPHMMPILSILRLDDDACSFFLFSLSSYLFSLPHMRHDILSDACNDGDVFIYL